MKIRKRLVKITLACIMFMCLSSYVKASEYDRNVPDKILDIANGSNELYRQEVPFFQQTSVSYLKSGVMNVQFSSGGINHTHQYILASALIILNHDFGNSILNQADYAQTLMSNTDWPDVFGNETDYGTFAGHFYDPDTEKNWLGQTSPTCKTRATSYFNKAVNAYNNGDMKSAMMYLGRGTHYVSDANEPHHAANLTALNSNHTEFEEYVDVNRESYTIANNTLPVSVYETAYNTTTNNLIRNAAWKAKALVPKTASSTTFSEAGEASVTNAITTVAQYIYKFGKTVGIY